MVGSTRSRNRYPRRAVLAGMAAFLVGASTCALAQSPRTDEASLAEAADRLTPGDYLWAPGIAPEGPVLIIVSLREQHAHVYRNGVLIGISTVSTGKAGYDTPTGVFTVLQKHVEHKSNLYEDAPMPFMQRLTWSGIAMHAGNLPGYPASHGCIRLPLAFAKLLFGVTRLGLTVVITDDAGMPRIAPTPAILSQGSGEEVETQSPDTSWQPEKSPSGPVSIVISATDRRLIVLRNGIEIGSAAVTIARPVLADRAFMLRSVDTAGYHWLRLPLPGQAVANTEALTGEGSKGLTLPDAFRRSLLSILTPGATVIVTRDPLSNSIGEKLTIISGER